MKLSHVLYAVVWISQASKDGLIAQEIRVPATGNIYLSGMPAGTASSYGDSTPGNAPVQASEFALIAGQRLRFLAGGRTSNMPSGGLYGPDGNAGNLIWHETGPENGIANVRAPYHSLLGVFLDDRLPTATAAPAAIDFSTAASRDYAVLSPLLKQVFFIGDGRTSKSLQQEIQVPAGATRLFFGTMDVSQWCNNPGSLTVFRVTTNAVKPVILLQPENQSVSSGNSAFFAATVDGAPPLAYQWTWGQSPLNQSPLASATNSSLTLNNVGVVHQGYYQVIVTNAFGSVTSQAATLSVAAPALPILGPTGNYYQVVTVDGVSWSNANAAAMAKTYQGAKGHLVTLTSSSEDAFVHSLLSFWNSPVAGNEFWAGGYQNPLTESVATQGWTWVNNDGTFPGSNGGPGYARWVPGEPNDGYGVASEQYLAINHGTQQAWNDEWNQALIRGYLVEYDKAVTLAITTQPQSQIVRVNTTATFFVVATGTPPLNYQWCKNSAILPGATTASLTLTNVQIVDAGSYSLTVSNQQGLVTSKAATITVVPAISYVTNTVFVSTLAGSGIDGVADGVGANTQFHHPDGGYVDAAGNVYLADWANHRIRKVTPDGTVSTLAGTGVAGHRDGPANQAQFNSPIGLCVDRFTNVFVTDMGDHYVRKITPDGLVSTVAGSGVAGYRDGPGAAAQFNFPNDVVVDAGGTLYVSEFNNHTVRKITPEGVVSTWVGNGTPGYVDGPRTSARLKQPGGLGLDGSGNLYVSEFGNQRVRKVSVTGEVTTLAGNGQAGYVDGEGSQAQFGNPGGMVIDAQGYVYVADGGNHAIRRISPGGFVETVAGTGAAGYRDGMGAEAQLWTPSGVGQDGYGNLYVPEWDDQRVRKIRLGGPVVQRQLPADYAPGIPVTVVLVANPWATTVTYAVEDQPPVGWTISNLSHDGVFDAVNRKVKFGPFLDAVPRTLSYVATPPSQEQGLKSFAGLVSVNGADQSIEGAQSLAARPFHPADRSPGDWQMSISEMTAYSGAWKRGTTWAVGPNPIPIGYVTRAALLWKGGETYGYDREITTPPMCWVNVPRLRVLVAGLPERMLARAMAPATTSSATAQMANRYVPGQPLAVTITVTPAPGVMVYAVEDQPPAGWSVSTISDAGVYDATTQKVKWGPFFDHQVRALSYQATSPMGTTGVVSFQGTVSWEGTDEVIGGQRQTSQATIPSPRLELFNRGLGNCGFQLRWTGEPGAVYEVLVSGDLRTWTTLMVVTNVNEVMSITDPITRQASQQFYRVEPR